MRLSVGSAAEAVRALCAVLPGAREILAEGEWRIAAGPLQGAEPMQGAEPVSLDTLGLGLGACTELHIHPHAAGAGADPEAPVLDGPSLIGTAYALTSIPSIGEYAAREAPDRRPSYPYDGPVNATAQGGPVPVIYGGPIRVGSTAVSSGIDAERVQLTEPVPARDGEWYQDSGDAAQGGGAAEPRAPVEGDMSLRTHATLRAVDLIGEGPMRGLVDGLKSVFVDGTAVENADGTRNVEGFHLSWRAGTPDQAPPEGVAEVSAPQRFSEKVAKAGPVTRTVRNTRDSVRLTLRFPRLETIGAEGEGLGASVRFQVEVQPSGEAFSTVLGPQTISDRSIAPAELSWRVPLSGDAPYTVRVTRLSEDATSDRVHNELYWVGLDELTEVRQSYPHTALVGIEAEADKYPAQHKREYEVYGRIVEVPSNYDPDTRAYTGAWDGTFKSAWTDNGAWCVFDLLRSSRYGLGGHLEAARIEAAKWELYAMARFNDALVDNGEGGTEPRYRFSGVIGAAADARSVLSGMLSNFRAGHYYADGSVVPVQDAHEQFPASDRPAVARKPVALLGPANVEDGAFEYADAEAHSQRASAVAVSFNDPADGYRLGIELVVDDALVAKYGYCQKDIAAMYCTSRAQAHRHGRHLLQEQEKESATVRYRAGLDQASIRPGDVVRIADPISDADRNACRILEIYNTDTVYILAESEPAVPTAGESEATHTPTGWSRERPERAPAKSVWCAERTLTYEDGVFYSATPWGGLTEVAAPLPGTRTVEFPAGSFRSHSSVWEGAVLLDRALIAGGGVAYLRYFQVNAGGPKIRLAATTDGQSDADGPEFTDGFETADDALTLVSGASSVVLKGPGHPDNVYADPSEPYWWSPDNHRAVSAFWVVNHDNAITLTLSGPVTADTVTALGVIARALITVGRDANWYSRHAGQRVGRASGDLSLDTNVTLSRVMFYANFTRLRLNRTGTGIFSSWYAGAGHGKSLYLALGDSLIELDIDRQHVESGASFLNLTVPADAVALAQAVSVGDPVNLVIADTGTGSRV